MSVAELDERRPVLGGSTIAAAAGIDPWCSRVELFYRLRGELPPESGEQLEWGKRLQPVIFAALRERGIPAVPLDGHELRHPATPWLVGHPDGCTEAGDVVEAKVTGGYGYRKHDALPLGWQAQAQTYMRLAGSDRTLVAALVGGVRLDVHELHRDDRATDLLFELAAGFVDSLRTGVCPPPDGSASAREALAARFPRQEPGKTYRLTRDEWNVALELRARREQARVIAEQITALENRLKAACPDAETFIDPFDNTVATWREVVSHRFDTKLFREERPDLAGIFTTETRSRRFTFHD